MLVKELKLKVVELTNVPVERQRMICMGKQLQDNEQIGHYGKMKYHNAHKQNFVFLFLVKEDGVVVHLVAKVEQPAQ